MPIASPPSSTQDTHVINVIELIIDVENEWDLQISDDTLNHLSSLDSLVDHVCESLAARQAPFDCSEIREKISAMSRQWLGFLPAQDVFAPLRNLAPHERNRVRARIQQREPQPPYTYVDEVEFIMEVEGHWNLIIPDDDAVAHHSLQSLSRYIADALGKRGETPDADLILREIMGFASRHFDPVPVSPDFDPFALLRVISEESRARAPYFRTRERKRRIELSIRKLGLGTAKLLAIAVYLAFFVTGVRLMIAQDTRLAAIGCVIFLIALQLPYIVVWAIWYRRDNRSCKYSKAFLNRKSAIANRKSKT